MRQLLSPKKSLSKPTEKRKITMVTLQVMERVRGDHYKLKMKDENIPKLRNS